MRRPDADHGKAFMIGVWMIGVGAVGAVALFAMASFFTGRAEILFSTLANLCVLIFAAGIIVMGYPLLLGAKDMSGASGKKIVRYDQTRVVARYALNAADEMLFDESYINFDDPQTRFYVRLQPPNQVSREFRCGVPVWYQCAEGMLGIAYIQGDWVGQFTPTGNASGRSSYP